MSRHQTSLHMRTIVIIIALLALGATTFLVQDYESIYREASEQGHRIGLRLSRSTSDPLWKYDLSQVKTLIDAELSEPALQEIVLFEHTVQGRTPVIVRSKALDGALIEQRRAPRDIIVAIVGIHHRSDPLGELEIVISVRHALQRFYITAAVLALGLLAISTGLVSAVLSFRRIQLARLMAEEASTAKDQFLANISHELRTPMNGIIGMTEMLRETPLVPAQRESLDIILRSAQSLQVLLNDLLDYSKMTADKIVLAVESFSPAQAITEVLSMLRPLSDSKQLTIIAECQAVHETVRGDPVRFRQIITNLVGNAIKFCIPEGVVILHGEITSRSSEKVRMAFSVADSGIGIAPENIPLLFERFQQGDNSITRRFGGTGLGLAISRALIQRMGGQITIRSIKEVGTRLDFQVEFGVLGGDNKYPAAVSEDHSSLPSEALRVLVVEDNLINQKVIGEMLRRRGHGVTLSQNGEEALLELKKQRFDLVVMDLHMPIMSGVECLQAVRRSQEWYREIPIIVLTADAYDSTKHEMIDLGANGFLTKPVRSAELDRALQAIAARQRQSEGNTHATH